MGLTVHSTVSERAALIVLLLGGLACGRREGGFARPGAPSLAHELIAVYELGLNLPALKAGTDWYRAFRANHSPSEGKEVFVVLEKFREKRAKQLNAAAPAFVDRLGRASSPREVDRLLAIYVGVPFDKREAAYQKITTAAQKRKQLGAPPAIAQQRQPPVQPTAETPEQQALSACRKAFGNDDYPAVVARCQPLAERGNQDAQIVLGKHYRNPHAPRTNIDEAMAWFARAAEKGNNEARTQLGMTFAVNKQYARAVETLQLAVVEGYAPAMLELAEMHCTDSGFEDSSLALCQAYAELAGTYAGMDDHLRNSAGSLVSENYRLMDRKTLVASIKARRRLAALVKKPPPF